jgi:hypothetical protein
MFEVVHRLVAVWAKVDAAASLQYEQPVEERKRERRGRVYGRRDRDVEGRQQFYHRHDLHGLTKRLPMGSLVTEDQTDRRTDTGAPLSQGIRRTDGQTPGLPCHRGSDGRAVH